MHDKNIMSTSMRKIYIVEDDEDIREIVHYTLSNAGFEVTSFENAQSLYAATDNERPNLILLDIMLPGDDGLIILKKLRNTPLTKKTPIILLTAKGSEFDKVKGLDMGADDYITKPFSVLELISRINALLRRCDDMSGSNDRIEFEGILIDSKRREVSVNGKMVALTFKEYELLYYMMLNKGLALDRKKILDAVWGYDFEGESRTLDMHIRSLRRKLDAYKDCIKTIRNIGYKLVERNGQ